MTYFSLLKTFNLQILQILHNTIHAARNSIEELIKVLETESKSAIGWFKTNDMIVNLDKFQAMIMTCDKKRKQI